MKGSSFGKKKHTASNIDKLKITNHLELIRNLKRENPILTRTLISLVLQILLCYTCSAVSIYCLNNRLHLELI